MVKTVFLDTGPLVATLDKRDQHHLWAQARLDEIKCKIVTCESVLSETLFLTRNFSVAIEAIKGMIDEGLLILDDSYLNHKEMIFSQLLKYADINTSLADINLLSLYNVHKGEASIFTTDSDFHVFRDSKGDPLNLISPYNS